jgi:hypothetical protein
MTTENATEPDLDRLAELLMTVRSGDAITLTRCANATGLSLHAAWAVLDSLARRDVLVRRRDGAFVPRSVYEELVEV